MVSDQNRAFLPRVTFALALVLALTLPTAENARATSDAGGRVNSWTVPHVLTISDGADLSTLNSRGYLKDAFFDFDKYDLREDARTALAADAQWLKRYSSIQVLVEGHCDSRGTEEYNLSLGQKRAASVKDYLVSLGLDGSRINTVSYGKTRPFCSEETEGCWQQNRRGHFVITAK